jgi:hypothetical protein
VADGRDAKRKAALLRGFSFATDGVQNSPPSQEKAVRLLFVNVTFQFGISYPRKT